MSSHTTIPRRRFRLSWLTIFFFFFSSAAYALVAVDRRGAKIESLQEGFETQTLVIPSSDSEVEVFSTTSPVPTVTPNMNRTEIRTTFSTRKVLAVVDVTEDGEGQVFESSTGTRAESLTSSVSFSGSVSASVSVSPSTTKTTSSGSSAWPFTIIPKLRDSIMKVPKATATAAKDGGAANNDTGNLGTGNADTANNDMDNNDTVNAEGGQRFESESGKIHASHHFVSVSLSMSVLQFLTSPSIDTDITLSRDIVEVPASATITAAATAATAKAIKTVTVTHGRTSFSTIIVKPDVPTGTDNDADITPSPPEPTKTIISIRTHLITSIRTHAVAAPDAPAQTEEQPQPQPPAPDPVVVTVVVTTDTNPTHQPQLNPSPSSHPLLHALPLPPSPSEITSLFHPPQNRLLNCYHTGRFESRTDMIQSITSFCRYLSREARNLTGPHPRPSHPPFYIPKNPYDTHTPPDPEEDEWWQEGLQLDREEAAMPTWPLVGYRQHQFNFVDMGFVFPYTHVLVSLEVKEGCEWRFDEQECNKYLRIPVDECQRDTGEQFKKGGTVQGRTGYGDFDSRPHLAPDGVQDGIWESGWLGDLELAKMEERGEREERVGERIEERGMSRTCLVWRVDAESGKVYPKENAERLDLPRKWPWERKKKEAKYLPVTMDGGQVVYSPVMSDDD